MRMLLVNHLLDPAVGGGTAERTYQLARFMSLQGFEPTILTMDIGLGPARRDAIGFGHLEIVPCLNRRYFLPWLSMRRVRAVVEKCDVVMMSGHWTILNAIVARACKKAKRPYIFSPAGALVPFGRSLFLKRIYDATVGRSIVRNAACRIAVTAAERADFMPYQIDDKHVVVIPNGIDPDAYGFGSADTQLFRSTTLLGDAPYLLFLGRLNPIKGPDLLIEAFSMIAPRHPGMHLVVAGPDDGMRASLQEAAEALGLRARIHFPGFVEGAVKAAALSGASLLVIPSRREAMSIVVLEGGICGCPVVFTDTCGLEALALRQAGSMTGVSALELAGEIDRLLSNPELRQNQAERLRHFVLEEYTWAAQAQRHIKVAQQVLSVSGNLHRSVAT